MIAYVPKSDEFSYLRNDVNSEKSTCPQNKSGIQDYSIGIQIEEEINQQKNLTLIKTKKRHLLFRNAVSISIKPSQFISSWVGLFIPFKMGLSTRVLHFLRRHVGAVSSLRQLNQRDLLDA